MILHLITDEKFADYAIKQFSAVSNNSEFILVQNCDRELCYIKQRDKIKIIKYNSADFEQLLKGLSTYSAILSHGLFEKWQWEVILSAPKSVKIAWMFWGGEVYGLPQCKMRFLSPSAKFLYYLKKISRFIKGKKIIDDSLIVPQDVFNRIDYCLTDEKEECDFANSLLGTQMQHLWYNYYSIEETIGDLMDSKANGNNILLGNSSTFECNHIMIMRKLRKLSKLENKIILPLSYGDSWLRERLLYVGNKLFKNNFIALKDFISRDEYNSIIKSCGVVIMPHYRPQAFGNILTALWLGSKVYLSKRNIVYPFYKRLGVKFYTIEEDFIVEEINSLLSEEDILYNRSILMNEYSFDSMIPKINEVINTLK